MEMKSLLVIGLVGLCFSYGSAQVAVDIQDSGWRLWLDKDATWEKDTLYLPGDIDLRNLPSNPPTGGWGRLDSACDATVTLPTTVEEHFWGARGLRPYRDEYGYSGDDSSVKNGNYLGVSWWVRDISVPKSYGGKKALLTVRGARLRAEVYVNRQLVGYNIITETAFTCDVTAAIRPGKANQIAIRITNPGGRLDWVDTELMKWGNLAFHKSHGFGGLDRGLQLVAHDSVYWSDLWVMNRPDLGRITAKGVIANTTAATVTVKIRCAVNPSSGTGASIGTARQSLSIPPRSEVPVSIDISCRGARPWSLEKPNLYNLLGTISAQGSQQKSWSDRRSVSFGFRWFEATGIGMNAVLRFNGQRTRLISAISWGFWGKNGLWPTPELAEREVRAAKTLGMNCIQFHRNIGKTEVLDAQDRLGLLRYMEPGGGQTAFGEKFSLYSPSPKNPVVVSGEGGDPRTFAERYMEEKIVRMVRDHRSHPSLVMYSMQNEIHPDLSNPRIFRLLRRVHQEDPSRIVVLKSGFPENKPVNQAWMQPFDDSVYYDHGDGYSGWWDAHTVGGPGVWRDDMYKSPVDFTHRSENDSEIVVWGEMLGAAAPDNHAAMVRELSGTGKSYDLQDHQEILHGYDQFLDRWGFRTAFPTADALFTSIGNKSYDFWGRVIETARLSESNDFFVISGWESTAIENHSGLVDNLRGFKGDPTLMSKRLAPVRPAIKPRSLVVGARQPVVFDLFLVNESHSPHGTVLKVTCTDGSGKQTEIGQYAIPLYTADRFVYAVASAVQTPPIEAVGTVTIQAEVVGGAGGIWTEEVLIVDPLGSGAVPRRIGIVSSHPALRKSLEVLPGVAIEPYHQDKTYDLLVAANRFVTPPESSVEPDRVIQGTDEPGLYRSAHYGSPENFDYIFPGLIPGKAKVTLKFAEIFRDAPGIRVFDMAINGSTVLHDFDVFSVAGGKNIAIDTSFTVASPDGIVRITVPRVASGSARICAIKIEAPDTVIAVKCGGAPYRDKHGLLWRPYQPPVGLDEQILARVRQGVPLLVLSEGQAATTAYASRLAEAGAMTYQGYVGEARASWMGSWYFVRKHPVFEGMPSDCAMGSYYQVGVDNASGVVVDGPEVDVFVGYSRDHDRAVGAGAFSTKLGNGNILFECIPGVVSGLAGEAGGMHPVLLKRLLANSLKFLAQ